MDLKAEWLFSASVHEFEEVGILPAIRDNVYDSSRFISKDSVAGGILKSLFGYNTSPSLLESLYIQHTLL
jgi:high-affinity iron transporter